jgi:cysteine desulfurase
VLYFDHNSTTPVDSRVADVLDRANRACFGNASSVHMAGQSARQNLDRARRGIARALGAQAPEIVFTSGGTEANNLALRGVLTAGMHAVTSVIEHPSVLEPFRQLEREGVAVTYLPVDANGLVHAIAVGNALRPSTALVSIMAANNETGALQPLAEIARLLRERRLAGHPILFHSDGVQAVGKLDLDLGGSGVDLFAISSHKLYAPKGFGALYVRRGVQLRALHLGGRHERGMRAGTENVAAAMALDCALELCSSEERKRMGELRAEFERRLLDEVPDATVNAGCAPRLPNTSNILFPGTSGEALLIALDRRGICVSTGSACSSGSVEPSHVLLEMGLTVKQARGSIRFSFGRGNRLSDVEELVSAVSAALHRMREKQLV